MVSLRTYHSKSQSVNILSGLNFTKILHGDTYSAIDPAKLHLQGRSIFITGGSSGIGKATALSFAKAGASQIAIGAPGSFGHLRAELEDAAKAAGRPSVSKVLLLNLDVLDRETVTAAAAVVEKEFGKLDILINNAGFMALGQPILSSDEDEYWKTYEINMRGTY
jgi:NAD(P)-dependent dehydrogenase (short-subunit alcohol dehydrogenase family)